MEVIRNNISIFSEIEQRIITFSKKQTKFNNYISKAMNVLILYIGIDIIYIFSRTVQMLCCHHIFQ